MKWYIKLLRWIWEFPQCLLGYILTKIYNVEYKEDYNGIAMYAGKFPGGISLGLYILLSEYSWKNNVAWAKEHEYGHTRQSLYLGPLYLIIIGLSSLLWAAFHGHWNYYKFWTEKWADKLGGVTGRYY